jgi:hypothetical protein
MSYWAVCMFLEDRGLVIAPDHSASLRCAVGPIEGRMAWANRPTAGSPSFYLLLPLSSGLL